MAQSIKKTSIVVGLGSCGIAAGAQKVYDAAKEKIVSEKLPFDLGITSCNGTCFREPIVDILPPNGEKQTYGHMDAKKISALLDALTQDQKSEDETKSDEDAFLAKQKRIVLRNCGQIDPEKLEDYLMRDGYKALAKALDKLSPEKIIEIVSQSGLRGRGGAGFPTGMKWKFAYQAAGDTKYIICNADEGDPGAFMDRSVLEGDPFSVLEGMAIAAYAIGADHGYIYCRAEYPLAIKRLRIAIKQAYAHNYLGDHILGTDFSFHLKIKEGAGAFVCGEETALIASIEGRRGMPRLRPPFPAQSGLWGKPTNINNVETFANVAYIVLNGPESYNKYGTEKSKGTKVFALAGKIARGGLVEVPMGMTIDEIVHEIGGGSKSGKAIKAVQMGGPSGGCIPRELFNTPIDYDAINQTGAIMGSGGMVVMDEGTCMVDVTRFFLAFTQKESCGKCTFCRIGTRRMLEILTRITEGKGEESDLDQLQELAERIKKTSLCGLGQTAPNPVLTTLKYFRHEYEEHIKDKKCRAGVCKALITYSISDNCTGCTACARVCPTQAISGEIKQKHSIDDKTCIRCGMCLETCKFGAIEVE